MSLADTLVTVLYQEELGGGYFLLGVEDARVADAHLPGQFVMIETAVATRVVPDPLLRRPFSVQRAISHQGRRGYEILYRVVGSGTRGMSHLRPGDQVRALGPLGKAFSSPLPGESLFLVGGGVGIPPLVSLADSLDRSEIVPYQVILGVRGGQDAVCFEGFRQKRRGPVHLCTDDGSIGFRGNVVARLLSLWEETGGPPANARVRACGPMPMLNALGQACEARKVPCEVSVETLMGCGLGACMACVLRARDAELRPEMSPYDRWLLACLKGPVFDSREVVLRAGFHPGEGA